MLEKEKDKIVLLELLEGVAILIVMGATYIIATLIWLMGDIDDAPHMGNRPKRYYGRTNKSQKHP